MGCTSSKNSNDNVEQAPLPPPLPPRPQTPIIVVAPNQQDPEAIMNKLVMYSRTNPPTSNVHILANHLLKIINVLNESRQVQAAGDMEGAKRLWKDAYEALSGDEGHRVIKQIIINGEPYKIRPEHAIIDSKKVDYQKAVNKTLKKGFHSSIQRFIRLPDVAFGTYSNIGEVQTAADNPELAWAVLPVMLEEWIHLFQSQIDGYLSDDTTTFGNSDVFRQKEKSEWDLKEVDIYAIYRQLGWTCILEAFRGRYAERGAFEEFMQGRQTNGQGLVAARAF